VHKRTKIITAFPYPLIWDSGVVDMRVQGKDFKVGFKRTYRQQGDGIPNPGWSPGIGETSNVEIPYDTHGLAAYTVVEIAFPMYVEPEPDDQLRGWIQSVINWLLEVYRFATEEFHVKGLPLRELWEYEVQSLNHADEQIGPPEIMARRVIPFGVACDSLARCPCPTQPKAICRKRGNSLLRKRFTLTRSARCC
jgi:hypothetical protein